MKVVFIIAALYMKSPGINDKILPFISRCWMTITNTDLSNASVFSSEKIHLDG